MHRSKRGKSAVLAAARIALQRDLLDPLGLIGP
jgi:hypothetical protein